jgi:hypothetical protein
MISGQSRHQISFDLAKNSMPMTTATPTPSVAKVING